MMKFGMAICASMLPNGVYQLVCSGCFRSTSVEDAQGVEYGAMTLLGDGTNDLFTIVVEMEKVLPQLRPSMPWMRPNDGSFSRMVDGMGGVRLIKEGHDFQLRNIKGRFAEFTIEAA